MISLVAAITAITTILGAGLGAIALCGERKIAATELLALSWFCGMAIVSVMLWILSFFLRGATLQAAVTLGCVSLSIFGVKNFRRRRPTLFSHPKPSYFEVALLGLLGLEMVLIVYASFQHTLGWDGLLIWELKARYAFLHGGALPSSYFTDSTRVFSHPEYPIGLPLTEMWLYLWMGDCNQFWVKILSPVFYLAGMILLAHGASELAEKRWVGLLAAVLFLFVPSVNTAPGGVFVAYADLPLGFFYLGAVVYLIRYLRDGARFSLVMFSALAAALPWIKRDGMILWGILAMASGIILWRRKNLAAALLSFLPGICVIAAWSVFLASVHAPLATGFVPATANALVANSGRIGSILHALATEMFETSRWSLFWPAVALSFACSAWRQRSEHVLLLATVIILPIGLYSGTYIFSGWSSYLVHIERSLPRLLMQVTPVAWLAIALALRAPEPNQPVDEIRP
jgi:hypothetical protein